MKSSRGKSGRTLVATIGVAAVLGMGAGAFAAQNDAPKPPPIASENETGTVGKLAPPTKTSVPSGKTQDGRSFGPALVPTGPDGGEFSAESDKDQPDLIAVQGDNGRKGYVVFKDLMWEPEINSPEDAARYMEARKQDGPRVLPVYAEDGVTQIDSFTLQ